MPESPSAPLFNQARVARLPYEPPAVEESSEFETLALACVKEPFTECYYAGETSNS